jgi:micrococcal nuclease
MALTTYKISSVKRVVDGDTVDLILDLGFNILYKQRIRLLGIDTPESRTSDVTEKIYGTIAKHALEKWCDKPFIELRCDSEDCREKFGRVLGEIWVYENDEWINVNKWLCENHFAVPYHGNNKETIKALHLENRSKILQ